MYKGKKIIAFIPARAGSKRLKNKNIKKINKKPLFQYSVDVAKSSKYVDDVIVSTDSKKILDLSIKLGCLKNDLRPDFLSSDTARIIDSIMYEKVKCNLNKYDAIVLLQPTSPYRTPELLDNAIEEYFKTETSLITVVKAKEQPLMMRKIENKKLKKIISDSSDIRSQDFPNIYKIIGNIYINNMNTISSDTVLNENEVPFIIDEKYAIDIDTLSDFIIAKKVLGK